MGSNVVIWPKHFNPLPPGYTVVQLDSGHYMWKLNDEKEGAIDVDQYRARRCAFLHFERNQHVTECDPGIPDQDT